MKGDTGISPNISVGSVIGLPYGTNPIVYTSGTTANPILNFGLVQGPQGFLGATPIITIGSIRQIYYNSNDPATVTLDSNSTPEILYLIFH